MMVLSCPLLGTAFGCLSTFGLSLLSRHLLLRGVASHLYHMKTHKAS